MKLFNFVLARNHQVKLLGIEAPKREFTSLRRGLRAALAQEQGVSRQIDALYELAFSEKVFAAMAELQWFITEQVEEEKTVREIVAKLQMVKDDPASLLDLDRELGARKPAAPEAARSDAGFSLRASGGLKPAAYDSSTRFFGGREALEDAFEAGDRSSSMMRFGVRDQRSRPPLRLTVTWAAMSSPSRVLSM